MNLFKASNQWMTRPDDERFETLQDLDRTCQEYRATAVTASVPYGDLTVQPRGDDMLIAGKKQQAVLTHWAFGQLASRAGAPATYLRTLTSALAASCLNQGLERRDLTEDRGPARLLLHQNGSLVCRALTSDKYARIWNSDITGRLQRLAEEQGWRVPPARPARDGQLGTRPATQADVNRLGGTSGLSINVGDLIAPAGLYASDHDLFAFLINEDRLIDGGNGETLGRGFFVWNSEVGASSFGIMTFLYEYVCGNHIVWGAKGVKELRIRHVGDANEAAFKELQGELKTYADESASDTEAKIAAAKRFSLGADKDAVLDAVFGLRVPVLSRKRIGEAYDLAETFEAIHGAPTTAWGLASGLTRLSQTLPYADERVAVDRAAGKVLEVAF
jgi:hypothetical protein